MTQAPSPKPQALSPTPQARDIHVLGAGPAGATAALLLAGWGHQVTLFSKRASDHRLAVSLPPSCAKLFDAIGVADAIDRADFIRSTGNTVWWGNQDPRVEYFASGQRGWQLEVHQLGDLLASVAASRGVRSGGSSDPPAAGSAFVLDCTGRSGVIARSEHLREYEIGPRTVALVGEWRSNDRWNIPDDTHTLIESYEGGWMWSVPTRRGTRHIAAMVDPKRSDLSRSGSSSETYLNEIRKTRVFQSLTTSAALGDGPWGWDASSYHAREYAGDGWLLVGDAGSFIDPLSSAGVKKALASAWLAAIVTNTCVTTPAMSAQALAFFSNREREIATQLTQQAKRFLSDAAAGHRHAFWDERSEHDVDHTDADEVRKAFDRLKGAATFHARRGDGARIEPRPCIRGNVIVLEPHVADGDIRYLSGIDMVALLELAPACRQVPDLYEMYVNRSGSAPLHDFLQALATAFAKGWLVAE